jgi:hypothetical protein
LPIIAKTLPTLKMSNNRQKKLSSQNENYFFCSETLIFNYRKVERDFHKVSGLFKNGQKKCPKSKSQNTLHFRKRERFPSYVGKKKVNKKQKMTKIPT